MYRVRGVNNLGLAILTHELGLVFVDINLLKISGLQVTRQMERNGMLGHIIVIGRHSVCNGSGPTQNVRAAMIGKLRTLSLSPPVFSLMKMDALTI